MYTQLQPFDRLKPEFKQFQDLLNQNNDKYWDTYEKHFKGK